MKSYNEIVQKLSNDVYHSYMGGSGCPFHNVDLDIVAFIYDKDENVVFADVNAKFRAMTESKS